ncbi:hypothetical protein B296_00050505 [Ensete ventricosum]|uniref:Uncharacterized protein n=1 Tax=Ensete ventricosum TaxID=4639 RepID=A0A426YEP3_ENSVE|nr:hypothetical protein B296_00050505 [Ensete ventricosum]
MSFASSHSESRSIKISAHRSRVLSCPSGDSVSVAVVPSSSVPGDSGTADALVAMQSFFNVDSTVTTRRLIEVRKNYFIPLKYELHVPLSQEHPYDAFPCGFSLSTDTLEATIAEQPTDASGSTVRTSADKDKGIVELEEVPKRGYTMQELSKVEDRTGANKYFASIMMRLRCADSEDPLVLRCWWARLRRCRLSWSPSGANRELEQEVGLLRSTLDGARNDRAHLEGDVLSLIKVIAFLEAKLKAEDLKAVAAYKASQGFESGLEKMGRVNYEFGYRVALERLRRKHPDIMIERDPFAECLEDANVRWTSTSLLTMHLLREAADLGWPRLSPYTKSMRLGTRQVCVGSSLRVSGVCHDGTREFAKRRPRLAKRLSGVAEKLIGNDGPRYSLGIGPSSDDVVGSCRKFARRFAKGIGKLTGNAKGDRRKEDQRTCRKIAGGCRSMWELGLN